MNQRDVFFEKRARLMTQRFFELEYMKRHFFIYYNDQISNCMPTIQYLLNDVCTKSQGDQAIFFNNLEIDMDIRIKFGLN